MIGGRSAEKPMRMMKFVAQARTRSNHTVTYGGSASMDLECSRSPQ